jgi:Ca2+-binding RTX toxin-like protein
MNRLRVLVLSTGLALLAAGAPASTEAATVELDSQYDGHQYGSSDGVVFLAAAGEANDVEVTFEGEDVVVTDRVRLVAGRGCAVVEPTVVRCTRIDERWHGFKIFLGGGNDRVNIRAWHDTMLFGGPGNDRLVGSRGRPTWFHGGAGRDVMVGGADSDRFLEGHSRNGSDTMLGGSGAGEETGPDSVYYGARRSPVRADVEGDRDDGAPGERDRIGSSVGSLVGGDGPDVLVGGPGDDALDGRDGRDDLRGSTGGDTLDGGGGRDTLRGGVGDDMLNSGLYLDWDPANDPESDRDRVFGGPGADAIETGSGADSVSAGPGREWIDTGPGNDRVDLRDGEQDLVECGDGRDAVRQDGTDLLLLACERHGARHAQVATLVSWTDAGDELILDIMCPLGRASDCTGHVAVDPGAPVPRAVQRFSYSPGSMRRVRLPLAGRSGENPVPPLEGVAVELSSTDPQGETRVRLVPLNGVPDRWPLITQGLLAYRGLR